MTLIPLLCSVHPGSSLFDCNQEGRYQYQSGDVKQFESLIKNESQYPLFGLERAVIEASWSEPHSSEYWSDFCIGLTVHVYDCEKAWGRGGLGTRLGSKFETTLAQ